MNSRMITLSLVLLLLAGASSAATGVQVDSHASQSSGPPTQQPDGNTKTVEPINAQQFRNLLASLKGHVVLVNIWATWCIPCIREFPDLSKLQQQYYDRGLRVIAIAIDEPDELESKVRPFVKARAPAFTTYHCSESPADKLISVLDPSWSDIVPTSYILDTEGTLKATLQGRKPFEVFEAAIQPYLPAAKPSAASAEVSAALSLVRQAIAAHGGEAFHRPRSIQLKGRAIYHPMDQSPDVVIDQLTITRVVPQASTSARQPGGKLRAEAWVGGKVFFRQGYDGTRFWADISGQAQPVAEYLQLDRHFGFGIIRFAETPGFVVEQHPDGEVEGRPAFHISITDLEKRRTDFWIDKETRLIHKVAFDTPSGHHERIYWPYDLSEQVREARHVKLLFKGHKLFDVMWESVRYNQDFPDEFFAPPADLQKAAN